MFRCRETAIGKTYFITAVENSEVFYWRDRNREADFVVRAGRKQTAIEVKSGRSRDVLPGMQAFNKAFKPDRLLHVGADGIAVEEFLRSTVEKWVN